MSCSTYSVKIDTMRWWSTALYSFHDECGNVFFITTTADNEEEEEEEEAKDKDGGVGECTSLVVLLM